MERTTFNPYWDIYFVPFNSLSKRFLFLLQNAIVISPALRALNSSEIDKLIYLHDRLLGVCRSFCCLGEKLNWTGQT